MKIQLALDRITMNEAVNIAQEIIEYVDIIEVGTSLIKDYGMQSVHIAKNAFPAKSILADLKTMDEGEYEFKAAYQNGADIATVMGAASIDTIDICYKTAKKYNKIIMIDLLETGDEKIKLLRQFSDAIFCIHTPKDSKRQKFYGKVAEIKDLMPGIKHLAIAGGVDIESAKGLKNLGIELVVIGAAITKSGNLRNTAKNFYEVLKDI